MVLYFQLPDFRILALDCRFEGDKYFGFGHMNISYIDVHTKQFQEVYHKYRQRKKLFMIIYLKVSRQVKLGVTLKIK